MVIDLLTGTIKHCSVKANANVRNVLNLEMYVASVSFFPRGSKTKRNFRNRHFSVTSVFRLVIDLLTAIKQCLNSESYC